MKQLPILAVRSTPKKRNNLKKQSGFSEVIAIGATFGAIFLLLALWTFDPKDPSIFTNQAEYANNLCGWIGAQVSALLLQTLGIGSFYLVFCFLFLAYSIYLREPFHKILSILAAMSISVLSFTILVSLQKEYIAYNGTLLLTGGTFGAHIGESLKIPLNRFGASLLAFTVLTATVAITTPVSVTQILGRLSTFIAKFTLHSLRISASYAFYFLSILGNQCFSLIRRVGINTLKRTKERIESIKEETKTAKSSLSLSSLKPSPSRNNKYWMRIKNTVRSLLSTLRAQTKSKVDTKEHYETTEKERAEPEVIISVTPEQSSFSSNEEKELPQTAEPPVEPEISVSTEDLEDEDPELLLDWEEVEEEPALDDDEEEPTDSQDWDEWELPLVEFLARVPKKSNQIDSELLNSNAKILEEKLLDFGIEGEVTGVFPGPVITLYEFKPAPGIKVSKISALSDDLSMAMSAQSVRILAPLPGKSVVGIEIPSENREKVLIREFIEKSSFQESNYQIPIVMGKDIGGKPLFSDLARMPHLLCAGQTGSGKSVFMNSLICSLLYRFSPDELKMILVDPKTIEFRSYHNIPHLLLPVVDDANDANIALKWAVKEMNRRYRLLAALGVRNLQCFNEKVEEFGDETVEELLEKEFSRIPSKDAYECFEKDENGEPIVGALPYIVILIDELADLMMSSKKEVEISIARIAQKARAAGIHLVIATQRPSTDVVTGLIKANLPSRVSFQLSSHFDSKTVLDRTGAERLLGQGDMLFLAPGSPNLIRLHGALVHDQEISKITKFLRSQGQPHYREEILVDETNDGILDEEYQDDLFEDALAIVRHAGQASASYLQRQLKIGYNRAARMIEEMENKGIVGPAEGSKPREVLLR